ncbi:MAG: hypothetical protein AABY64_12665, partial [Bdellovibrionota bacterium]
MAKPKKTISSDASQTHKAKKTNDFNKMGKNLLSKEVWGLLGDISRIRIETEKEIRGWIKASNSIKAEYGIDSEEWKLMFIYAGIKCRAAWKASEQVIEMISVVIAEEDDLFDAEEYLKSEQATSVKKEIDLLCDHGYKKAKAIMLKLGRPEEASDLFHDSLIKMAESGYDRKVDDFQKLNYLNLIMQGLAKDRFTSKNRDFLFNPTGGKQEKSQPNPVKELGIDMIAMLQQEHDRQVKADATRVPAFPKIHSHEELKKWKDEYD